MACDLLSKDWSRDEVNARLGHAPSSREIDRYINYLAIDRKKPKRKFHETQIAQLENQIAAMRDAERALSHEFQRFKAASVAGTALLKAQTRMAMLLAKRQLGKIGDVSFARMLERELQELTEKQEGLETLRRAT